MQSTAAHAQAITLASAPDTTFSGKTGPVRLHRSAHDWLHQVFRLPINQRPKFRLPDLLGACVSLVLQQPDADQCIQRHLASQLHRGATRDRRLDCHLWLPQMLALRALADQAWNAYPHPRHAVDDIASACVAVAQSLDTADAEAVRRLLAQARTNYSERVAAPRTQA